MNEVTNLYLTGEVWDLYDFNYEAYQPATIAATCQIGWEIHKVDGLDIDNAEGQIFQDTIEMNRVFDTWVPPWREH